MDKNSYRYKRAYNLVIKNYWRQVLRNWKTALPGFMLPAVGTIFVFYIPAYALSKVVEKATSTGIVFSDIAPLVMLFGGAWIFGELLWRIGIHYASRFQLKATAQLYNDGLEQFLARDASFFQDNFAGSLTKRTLAYANRFIDVGDTLLFNVFPNVVPAIFAVIVLGFYSVWLSVLLVASIVITLLIITPLIKRRRKLVTVRETAHTVVSGHVADVYGNIDAVRSHASEDRELSRHMTLVRDLMGKTLRSWDFQNQRIDTIISPIYVAVNVAGLLLALSLVSKNTIHPASLIVVFSYYSQVTRFMWEFNGIYRRLETAFSDAAQYTELLLDEPLINDSSAPTSIKNPRGEIKFDDVHFAYEEDGQKLFDEFSLSIPAGQKVGLMGRSGGGKTSITKLLLRFADINDGSIRIDGIDIRKLTQADLRSLIAYVPQDPVMFHRSISDNIAYGKPDASLEEIMAAARKAHAHDFISALPNGYETLVGERGIKLSGGQRQRVAIARAILKDAPILLLDEATSALDSESEHLIQDALKKLMRNKTALVIAHRLSTIQNMDRIIVMDEGQIVEQGTHSELLKHAGTYAKLWAHQSGGFLED